MKSVVIIGSGNVAYAFAKAIKQSHNFELKEITARNKEAGAELAQAFGCGFNNDLSHPSEADFYLIAVSDKAISAISSIAEFGDSIVAHTTGSVPMDSLSSRIKNRAVIYPLQSFTKGRDVDFCDLPLFIEGSSTIATGGIKELAESLSSNVKELDSQERVKLHIAAVFANNFTNYMYTVGEELAAEAGLDFEVLKPLIKETAEKAAASSSPRFVQTGPAIRNDFQTKSVHCEMLFEKPDLKNLYINISKNIWETSKKTFLK